MRGDLRDLPIEPHLVQELVDVAYVMLAIDSAHAYGLIEGGPEINVERCREVLDHGNGLGLLPSVDAIERLIAGAA